jgi:hypothetical protein
MSRLSRISVTWFALVGLLAPVAARAETPAAWPVLPVSTSASVAEPTASASARQMSYEQDAPASDDTTGDEAPGSISDAPAPALDSKTSGVCAACVNSCCNCMGDCRNRCWQGFIGVEAALLAPVVNHGGGNTSYNFTTTVGGAPTANNTYTTSSVNGMIVTPRIWAGLMGECWGVGVRYWRFANGIGGGALAGANGNFPLGANAGLYNQSYLQLQTFDLEAIRRIQHCDGQIWLSAGARYGQLNRTGAVSGIESIGGGSVFSASSFTNTGFNGVGPTVALYGWRPLGCDGCWNLFYGGRASYLWDGSVSGVAASSATFTSGGAGATSFNNASVSGGTANAFVGEVNLGLQYNHYLKCVPAIAFLRVAGEYQYWHINNNFSGGASSFANATAGPISSTVTASSAFGNSTLGLLGFGISTGFMY